VAQIELSLSGAFVPQARTPAEAEFVTNVERWTFTANAAMEPCLVINASTEILAVSPSCADLFGLGKPEDVIGKQLSSALRLIDFTATAGELDGNDVEMIPPLLAIRSERLARGLLRVVPAPGEPPLTVDAVTTPLHDGDRVAGSLTFFSSVR